MALEKNMALTGQPPKNLSNKQKFGVLIGISGLFILVLAACNVNLPNKSFWLATSLISIFTGIIFFAHASYGNKKQGINNDGIWFKAISSRGAIAWMAGIAITGFYIVLYFFAELLGLGQGINNTNTGLIGLFDPLSRLLSGNAASQWFVYGTLYTVAIVSFGVRFLLKYKKISTNNYVRQVSCFFKPHLRMLFRS